MTATIAPRPPITKRKKPTAQRQSEKSTRETKRGKHSSPRRPVPPIRWRTVPFAGFIAALLCGGLLTLLIVNNSLAAGSFEQARLQAERTLLFEQEQSLNQEVLALSSPASLRSEARQLGMVSAASTVFLDVASGKIFGIPKATGPGTPVAARSVPAAGADGEPSGETTETQTAGDDNPELPTPDLENIQNDGDGARSTTDSPDPREDQATVTDPADSSDGAQVSSGTAQDRAIVSGGE
jgi:hypothetical protein